MSRKTPPAIEPDTGKKRYERNMHHHTVKFCTVCRRPWEKDKNHGEKESRVIHHDGLPTLGLVRQTCDSCLEKEGENER